MATLSAKKSISGNVFTDLFGKKNDLFETSVDVLALSVALHRYNTINEQLSHPKLDQIYTLQDYRLLDIVTEFDHSHANEIRNYYGKKLILLKLKEKRISYFREDLGKFLTGSFTVVPEPMMRLAYRLPEFYQYDTEFAEFYNSFKCTDNLLTPMLNNNKINVSLSLVKKFKINRAGRKCIEYWLADPNGILFSFMLDVQNSLYGVWDSLLHKGPVQLQGYARLKYRDEYKFYTLDRLSLE